MTYRQKNQILIYLIAAVWFINGFFCKILNLVPRHQEIVASIMGSEHARLLTWLIGLAEVGMAVWIISSLWSRINALTQIIVIAAMNTLEFILVPELLLWGKANALFAFLFIILIYYNEFNLRRKTPLKQ